MASTIYDFKAKTIDGKEKSLRDYEGRVLLVVNVASHCGYTPQYAGLEQLHERYADKGLSVLGFPSNNFGGQEPGSESEIREFCTTNYGVKFDMFSKVTVLGETKAPLFDWLTTANPDFTGEIKWNFGKFLIDRHGKVVGRFGSRVEPTSAELTGAIEKALGEA